MIKDASGYYKRLSDFPDLQLTDLLTHQQACMYLNVATGTLKRLRERGLIQAYYFPSGPKNVFQSHFRYTVADVAGLLKKYAAPTKFYNMEADGIPVKVAYKILGISEDNYQVSKNRNGFYTLERLRSMMYKRALREGIKLVRAEFIRRRILRTREWQDNRRNFMKLMQLLRSMPDASVAEALVLIGRDIKEPVREKPLKAFPQMTVSAYLKQFPPSNMEKKSNRSGSSAKLQTSGSKPPLTMND